MYPLLADGLLLRHLEVPMLYHIYTEEMWELDEEALTTLQYFTGAWSVEDIAKDTKIKKIEIQELIDALGPELILDQHIDTGLKKLGLRKSPNPSLRAILIHTTLVCNLTCRHCYLDKSEKQFIDPKLFKSVVTELDQMQGYKVLLSGGEPLLHPQIFEMLESIEALKLRKMLLTNGILVTDEIVQRLKPLIQEVQISIDGIKSHNSFRDSPRAFEKSLNAVKLLVNEGVDVSVATMVHSQNLAELPELERILKDIGIKAWALDVPSQAGEFVKYPELYPSVEEAGAALRKYGWGAPYEETSNIYACGSHLCALMPNGDISKCGFFTEKPVGNLANLSLEECWKLIQRDFIWEQKALACAELKCPYLADCRGGCRFRASIDTGQLFGVDRVKCAAFNFNYKKRSDN